MCDWAFTRPDTTPTRHSSNAVLMLSQRLRRWPNIEPALVKCTMFEIPAVIQSVCLQAKDLLRFGTTGFEIRWNYLLIDVTQVYMNLL